MLDRAGGSGQGHPATGSGAPPVPQYTEASVSPGDRSPGRGLAQESMLEHWASPLAAPQRLSRALTAAHRSLRDLWSLCGSGGHGLSSGLSNL